MSSRVIGPALLPAFLPSCLPSSGRILGLLPCAKHFTWHCLVISHMFAVLSLPTSLSLLFALSVPACMDTSIIVLAALATQSQLITLTIYVSIQSATEHDPVTYDNKKNPYVSSSSFTASLHKSS